MIGRFVRVVALVLACLWRASRLARAEDASCNDKSDGATSWS